MRMVDNNLSANQPLQPAPWILVGVEASANRAATGGVGKDIRRWIKSHRGSVSLRGASLCGTASPNQKLQTDGGGRICSVKSKLLIAAAVELIR
jgi:hypothetical protein